MQGLMKHFIFAFNEAPDPEYTPEDVEESIYIVQVCELLLVIHWPCG